jgi:AcrR family transcriptional regulator
MTESYRPATRRMRNMQDKRMRIFTAAAELFAEHGFDGVTTQQVSDRADVGTGTLFRYAANKGELLLMVYNEEFGRAIHSGRDRAAQLGDRSGGVLAIIDPVLVVGRRNAPNTAAYQRELLFGPAEAPYRAVGLALVRDLEESVADVLLGAGTGADQRDREHRAVAARRAARSVFAVLHHTLVQPSAGIAPEHDPDAEARAQVAQIVLGYLATVAETPSS